MKRILLLCLIFTYATQSATKKRHPKKQRQTKTITHVQQQKSSPKKATPLCTIEQKKNTQRKITVHNDITDDMITYHFLGKHIPKFECIVNGQKISFNEKKEISIENNRCNVRYNYDFEKKHPWSKGSKEVTLEIPPNQNTFKLQFSWNNSNRIIAPQTKVVCINK